MHCSIAAHSLGVVVQVVEGILADMEIERGFWLPLKGRSVLKIPRQLGPYLYKRYVDSMSSGLRG